MTADMIRALADPGLLMREITVETLQSVIALPVEVKIDNDEMAREAFEILRNQVWLVDAAPHGAFISHRKDVRRVMLPMMLGRRTPRQSAS